MIWGCTHVVKAPMEHSCSEYTSKCDFNQQRPGLAHETMLECLEFRWMIVRKVSVRIWQKLGTQAMNLGITGIEAQNHGLIG